VDVYVSRFPKLVKVLLSRADCDLDVYVDGQDALRLTTDATVKELLTTAVCMVCYSHGSTMVSQE
jgi:hypothetical protein